jgi:hypothetical protein
MRVEELWPSAWVTTLFPWEEKLAEVVGIGRTSENQGKHDRVSYDATRLMDDNALANIHAAVVEIGVSRLIGAYCYSAVWEQGKHYLYASGLPDALRGRIEVEIKWRRTANMMPVDKKDAEANRLVLWAESKLATRYNCSCSPLCSEISPERQTSRVRLLGGGYAGELYPHGKAYNGDPNRVGVPVSFLTPIAKLELP